MSASAAQAGLQRRPPFLEEQFEDARQQREAATLGMWVFLASEILFFGVLFASYTVCRVLHPQGFAAGSRHTDVLLGTIEAIVLLLSSTVIALAVRAIRLGQRGQCWILLLATGTLGIAFLVMHGFEYYREYTEHLIPGIDFNQAGPRAPEIELFFCLYYFITGFHSLHVLVGVGVILGLAVRVARGTFGPGRFTTLELTALYWHLVDIVWIFVYPLIYLVDRST
ncbi:MAG: cytochrome c oxidase subunit 3 family protein [Steroidobacteraceae bacterium]